jgi:hypothetical protein
MMMMMMMMMMMRISDYWLLATDYCTFRDREF